MLSNQMMKNTVHYIHIKNKIQYGRYIDRVLRDIAKNICADHQPRCDAA